MSSKDYFWLASAIGVLCVAVSSASYIDKATVVMNVPIACAPMKVDTVRVTLRSPKRSDPVCLTCGPKTDGPTPDSARVR